MNTISENFTQKDINIYKEILPELEEAIRVTTKNFPHIAHIEPANPVKGYVMKECIIL